MSFFISSLKLFFTWIFVFAFSMTSANAADGLTLHWKAPTHFANGSRLKAKNDLQEYRLYYGSSVASIKDNVVYLEPSKESVSLSLLKLSKLKSSLVYFAMSSVAKDGSESELSPSIFYLP